MNKQLWILAGGNGAGKSTFYTTYLEPKGIHFVNADLIAKTISPEMPESASYKASHLAERLRTELIQKGHSFCFETVFSHPSKVDFLAAAKTVGYEIILIYIHLDPPQLHEARVSQRITEGGHSVPPSKIYKRLSRLMKNIQAALPLVDHDRILDNSSYSHPYRQVGTIKKGHCTWQVAPVPDWASALLGGSDII